MNNHYSSSAEVVDFDLHGIVGIRLLNPSAEDVRGVEGQVGPMREPLDGWPDLTIHFVDAIAHGPLSFVDWKGSAFDRNSFYLLGKDGATPLCRVELEHVGSCCELEVQRGAGWVPLLIHLVNIIALSKGFAPVHASAFAHNGEGNLVMGWSKGGKTEALLAFDKHDGQYVGDEWIWVSSDGRSVFGVPEKVRLWEWHLRQLPRAAAAAGRKRVLAFRTVRALQEALDGIKNPVIAAPMASLKRRLWVRLKPSDIFASCVAGYDAPLNKVFLFVTHDSPEVTLEPGDPLDVAERMSWSTHHEQAPLLAAYQAYRFAFPERSNAFIENARELERERLRTALAEKPTYIVRHPYPVCLEHLYRVMRPCVEHEGTPAAIKKAEVN